MKNKKIPDAILVLFLTAYSYFISYLYFTGYYSYFNLPDFLVEVTLENVIVSAFSIFSFLFIFYLLINSLTYAIPSDLNIYLVEIINKYIYLSFYYALTIILMKPFSNSPTTERSRTFILLALGIGVMIVIDFIIPIFSQKNVTGYKNKVIAERKKEKNSNKDAYEEGKYSLNNLLFKKTPSIPFLITSVALSTIFSYGLGNVNAHQKETFTVINNEMIVFGTYQKKFIVKKIDTQENLLDSDFSLIPSHKDYNFSIKQIDSVVSEQKTGE